MFIFANHYENEEPVQDQRQFFNGKTGRVEVMLEPVIYHDTFPPTENGWTVWDIEWNSNAEHFPTYAEARRRYEERVKIRAV